MARKRITKVYTKTGDQGFTSLVGGKRVSKASARVDAYGDVDEVNAVLGVVLSHGVDERISKLLVSIQNDLFIVGADLASPPDLEVPRIDEDQITKLENAIDDLLEELEPLKEFILPSGSVSGAYLHLARTVSRRAERKIVQLMQEDEEMKGNSLIYINRLSDLLFVMSRIENKRCNVTETLVEFNK